MINRFNNKKRKNKSKLNSLAREVNRVNRIDNHTKRRPPLRKKGGAGGTSLYIFKVTSLYSTRGDAFIEGTLISVSSTGTFSETNPSELSDILCYPSHVSGDMTSAKSHYSINSLVVCFQYSDFYISLFHLPVPFYIAD